MTPEDALEFVADHGVVLESARGPVPSLAEAIVGGPIRGSWWAHPLSHAIYALIQAVRDDPAVLVCRLVDGKVTYVHQRLWPAVGRLAPEIDVGRIAAIQEEHTSSGAHRLAETPFSELVWSATGDIAADLSRDDAIGQLGSWIVPLLGASAEGRTSRRTPGSARRPRSRRS